MAPSGQAVGVENSSTATRPPGRHTRTISRSPASVSLRFRSPKATQTIWNVPSGKGKCKVSASSRVICCSAPARRHFFAADGQHRLAEVGADDRRLPLGSPPIGQGQIGRAGANIEDRRIALRRHELYGFPPPRAIDAQRQQPVEQIVPPGDFAEHLLHAGGGFVEGRGTVFGSQMILDQTCNGIRDFFVAWNRGIPTSRRIQIDLVFRALPSEMAAEARGPLAEVHRGAYPQSISRRPCLQATGVELRFSDTVDQMDSLERRHRPDHVVPFC